MSGKSELVAGWIAKADSDLMAGQLLSKSGPYDIVCFHAQQAIEKLLKALLAFYDQPPPRTHDLEELQRLVLATYESKDLADLDLFEASDYAVMARYDLQFWPDEETAAGALSLAADVKRITLALLATKNPDNSPDNSEE